MSSTILRDIATTTVTDGHDTWQLSPVRAGDLRKVSVRCACGWRAVGIAATPEQASLVARDKTRTHLATAAPLAEVVTDPATDDTRASRVNLWAGLAAALIMLAVLAGGLDMLYGAVSGGDLLLVGR